ncbi:MAG: SGNH family hydrolase [Bauldia sp.]
MARRPHLFPASAALLLAIAVAVPANLASAQDPVPPGDIGGGSYGRAPPVEQPRRGGFLEMLFGPSLLHPFRSFQPPPQPVAPAQPAQPSEPPVPTVQILPKDANAKKILVLGDFVADGVAWGLDQTFADEPKLAIVDDANTNSGLARSDYYDWNAELPKILNEQKPDIVVVALGANDRQEMRLGNARVPTHSDTWESTYVQRIKGIASTLKVYGRPFFWVSAPPMRLSTASRDMAYLNEFYKPPVAEAGGDFVDIWDGFTSDEGNYISSGPDVNGQLRALRASDGINFTRAGRLKLAFYVEREIKRQTGIGEGTVDLLTSTNQNSQVEIGPDGQKRLVGPVISLTDPQPGASDVLAGGPGAAPAARKESETAQYLMIVKGEALPTVAGRADDFAWPPPKDTPAAAPATAPSPSAAN